MMTNSSFLQANSVLVLLLVLYCTSSSVSAYALLVPSLTCRHDEQQRILQSVTCRFLSAGHSNDGGDAKHNNNDDKKKSKQQQANKKKPRFFQQAHYHHRDADWTGGHTKRSASKKSKNKVWKSRKSIEDLEATMTKRWGTGRQQWTADPTEHELLDEDEDGSSSSDTTSGSKQRRPVLVPWQKQEQKRKKSQTTQDAKTSGATFSSASVDKKEDVMWMKRVRRNQERLRRKNTRAAVDVESSSNTLDYYDEDDEGYESATYNDDDNDDDSSLYRLDHLISPRPVGGRGSNAIPARDDDDDDGGPVFFFNPATAAAKTDSDDSDTRAKNDETNAVERQKQKKNRPASTPVLDDHGNPMYLTLQQARRDFESAVSVSEEDETPSRPYYSSPPPVKSWQEVGITSPQLLENLQNMKCASPLSVQDKACPSVLTGNDVLVGTYTGSGKTLAFLVPLAQRLLFDGSSSSKELQILIIAPGRELASQIVSVARSLLEGTGLGVMLSIGGTTFARNLEQIRKRKPSILVGTPGRIAELVVGRPGEKGGRLKVGSLQAVVLDEFDALLEYKPHRDPTKAIMTTLKRRHGDALQSVLCSATASDMIGSNKLESFLRPGYVEAMADLDDKLVTEGDEKSPTTRVSRTVIHGVIYVPHRRLALETLRRILHTEPLPQQVLIFADNARRVDIVVEKLGKMGIVAAPLHGGFGSEKMDRAEVSKALREGYVGIVVATELAARGIDAPLLTHVINLDLPTDASHYAHRAGRCGRGGRPGVVINMTTNHKERNIPQRFADKLGIKMHTVEARSGKLAIDEIDPDVVDGGYDG